MLAEHFTIAVRLGKVVQGKRVVTVSRVNIGPTGRELIQTWILAQIVPVLRACSCLGSRVQDADNS